MQRLAAAARAVAEGDLDQQVETEGSIEIAQVGQAFNEMTAALQEAETLRQNMVADVAHELRTPISVLQGNLWAILNDAYPLEKAEISRLYDEVRLLSRLVEDLRELALADAGQLHLNLRPTDVAQVIRRTVDNFGLAAEVQVAMYKTMKTKYSRIKSKGVKQAPFYVLLGAQMPSILIETSFISNPRECKRLKNAHYQELMCEGIIKGIKSYIQHTNPSAFRKAEVRQNSYVLDSCRNRSDLGTD